MRAGGVLIGWTFLALAALAGRGQAAQSDADPGLLDRQRLDAAFHQQLETLAARCDELQLERQAAVTRAWFVPRHPGRQYLFLASGEVAESPAADAPPLVAFWYRKFRQLRQEHAAELFQLASRAEQQGQAGKAYRLLHEVLHEDPEHDAARRILDLPATRRSADVADPPMRTRIGTQNHAQFGWPGRRHWIVESPHYRILTNHSSQQGVELARELERLLVVWRQAFFDYWASAPALRDRFAGGDQPLGPRRQFQVVLFRDRAEYLRQLGRGEPRIEQTMGYYLARDRTAYFYAGDAASRGSWLHEASHQLFQESLPDAVADPGQKRNFWAVEGVALYMESLRPRSGYCTLGGWDARRMQFARYRALNERFQVPLAELVALGRQQLQEHPEIRQLYSQAAGLMHFLLDDAHGELRQATVDYLRAIYRGDAGEQTLFERTGRDAATLDAGYRQSLIVRDPDLAAVDRPDELTDLCLGHCEVTDQGLRLLSDCVNLDWLDLAHTPVTDATAERLAAADKLRQLNLEGTRISDAALPTIGSLRGLEILDLSETAVTDQGLARLSGLERLTELWLTGTRITDAGLKSLYSLKKLRTLDVGRTAVTPAGWQTLRQQMPHVQ